MVGYLYRQSNYRNCSSIISNCPVFARKTPSTRRSSIYLAILLSTTSYICHIILTAYNHFFQKKLKKLHLLQTPHEKPASRIFFDFLHYNIFAFSKTQTCRSSFSPGSAFDALRFSKNFLLLPYIMSSYSFYGHYKIRSSLQ